MSEPFIAEIRMFGGNFAPAGWALCNGQLLAIAQNAALFSILGTTYGGNGVATFGLPNLQGRFPMHPGGSFVLGEQSGSAEVTLLENNLAEHTHGVVANSGLATTDAPSGAVAAAGGTYAASGDGTLMAPTGIAGGNVPFSTQNPYLCVNFIIALLGIFPSRN
jgi:microcystin-dependent protein